MLALSRLSFSVTISRVIFALFGRSSFVDVPLTCILFPETTSEKLKTEKTINNIHKAADRQLIFIVCETPEDVLKLVEGGVPIKKVNIGNMHMSEGKRQVAGSVAVDDKDVEAFRKLRDLGVELEIRRVPSEPSENIEKLFK